MSALELSNLCKNFGGLRVVQEVSFTVQRGERRLILGPNGAGKTTLFNLIAGDLAPSSGKIVLNNQDISTLPTHLRAKRGIGRTFQILTLFGGDTVLRNVMLALMGNIAQRWRPYRPPEHDRELRAKAIAVLERVMLDHIVDRQVSETSYGERRRLEIAMALAQSPEVILLDEPLAGLSREERKTIHRLLKELPSSLTCIMIEHDMDVALDFAEKICLLQNGCQIVEGDRDVVINDPRTREAYLA